jgi:hypothetical protein
MNRSELQQRLAAAEMRLATLADADLTGQTEPDPGETERWDAGQVWAHLAEFSTYWLGQVLRIIDAAAAGQPQPIPFGRTKTDPSRIDPIERDRREAPGMLLERVTGGIQRTRTQLDGFSMDQLDIHGLHPTRGEMSVARIIERFVVEHLEEHAAQLELLAVGAPAKRR